MATNRLSSSPTTVTVAGPSALALAAAALGSNQFVAFEQPSLSVRSPHPVSGIPCDVTEDGSQYSNHTMIDWAGKGCYDPVGRRVMWAACGAGNMYGGGYIYNTHTIYNEGTNTWSATRAFKGTNEGDNPGPIVHMYDNNCIDVKGRRLYKRKLPSREMMVFNLDTNQWIANLPTPADEGIQSPGAMDVVPNRGSSGVLWNWGYRRADGPLTLWEFDIAGGAWSVVKQGGTFAPVAVNGPGPALSFNPRAFGGIGAALLAADSSSWTLRPDDLSLKAAGTPPAAVAMRDGCHLCRDPYGPGWLYAAQDGYMYYADGSSWTRRSQLPGSLGGANNQLPLVMVPIDVLGVVWLITAQGSGARAWLYRP